MVLLVCAARDLAPNSVIAANRAQHAHTRQRSGNNVVCGKQQTAGTRCRVIILVQRFFDAGGLSLAVHGEYSHTDTGGQ